MGSGKFGADVLKKLIIFRAQAVFFYFQSTT